VKKLLLSLSAVLLSFLLGYCVWAYLHLPHGWSEKRLVSQQCPNGFVSIEGNSDLPLSLSVQDATCDDRDTGVVTFVVRNTGDRLVKYYALRAIYTYDNYIDDGAEFSSGSLAPGQACQGNFGLGTPILPGGKSAGKLRGIRLLVSQVEYNDGTSWRRPFLYEERKK
jgi:hypothetical protein